MGGCASVSADVHARSASGSSPLESRTRKQSQAQAQASSKQDRGSGRASSPSSPPASPHAPGRNATTSHPSPRMSTGTSGRRSLGSHSVGGDDYAAAAAAATDDGKGRSSVVSATDSTAGLTPAQAALSKIMSAQLGAFSLTPSEAAKLDTIRAAAAAGPGAGACGLNNLGNTCYMASSLQCLLHTRPLADYFLLDRHASELKRGPGVRGAVADAFAGLVKETHAAAAGGTSAGNSRFSLYGARGPNFTPSAIKRALGAVASSFDNYGQQDAQEAIAVLLDALHEDLNRVKQKQFTQLKDSDGRPDADVAAEAWYAYLLRNRSVVVDVFQAQLRSTLTCSKCAATSVTFDPYNYLSLPLSSPGSFRGVASLDQALSAFVAPETLSGREGWRCPKCKVPREAKKQLAVWSVPPVLIVHLKRFNNSRRKLTDDVAFPTTWDMSKYVAGASSTSASNTSLKYELYGVVNHYGGFHSGHYTAYVKTGGPDSWVECDDSTVRPVSASRVQSSAAYVLFYQNTHFQQPNYAGLRGLRRLSLTLPHIFPADIPPPALAASVSVVSAAGGSVSGSERDGERYESKGADGYLPPSSSSSSVPSASAAAAAAAGTNWGSSGPARRPSLNPYSASAASTAGPLSPSPSPVPSAAGTATTRTASSLARTHSHAESLSLTQTAKAPPSASSSGSSSSIASSAGMGGSGAGHSSSDSSSRGSGLGSADSTYLGTRASTAATGTRVPSGSIRAGAGAGPGPAGQGTTTAIYGAASGGSSALRSAGTAAASGYGVSGGAVPSPSSSSSSTSFRRHSINGLSMIPSSLSSVSTFASAGGGAGSGLGSGGGFSKTTSSSSAGVGAAGIGSSRVSPSPSLASGTKPKGSSYLADDAGSSSLSPYPGPEPVFSRTKSQASTSSSTSLQSSSSGSRGVAAAASAHASDSASASASSPAKRQIILRRKPDGTFMDPIPAGVKLPAASSVSSYSPASAAAVAPGSSGGASSSRGSASSSSAAPLYVAGATSSSAATGISRLSLRGAVGGVGSSRGLYAGGTPGLEYLSDFEAKIAAMGYSTNDTYY